MNTTVNVTIKEIVIATESKTDLMLDDLPFLGEQGIDRFFDTLPLDMRLGFVAYVLMRPTPYALPQTWNATMTLRAAIDANLHKVKPMLAGTLIQEDGTSSLSIHSACSFLCGAWLATHEAQVKAAGYSTRQAPEPPRPTKAGRTHQAPKGDAA